MEVDPVLVKSSKNPVCAALHQDYQGLDNNKVQLLLSETETNKWDFIFQVARNWIKVIRLTITGKQMSIKTLQGITDRN